MVRAGGIRTRLGLFAVKLSGTNHLAPLYVRLRVRLSIIHTYISFLILINTLRSRYYQPHFKSEDTEVKFMQVANNRVRFKLGSLGLQSTGVSQGLASLETKAESSLDGYINPRVHTLTPAGVVLTESKAITMAFVPFPLHTSSVPPVLQALPSQHRQAITLSNIWASSPNGISLRLDPPVDDPAWNFLESCLLGKRKWEWGIWRDTGMVKKINKNKIKNNGFISHLN